MYSHPAVWHWQGKTHVVFGYGERGPGALGGLLVVEADTGKLVFPAFSAGAGVTGGATVAANRAYFGDEQGRLRCLDLISHKLIWTRPAGQDLGAIESPPLVHDARVLVGTSEGFVLFVDSSSGRDIAPPAQVPGAARVSASPTLAGDGMRAFIAVHDGGVYAYDMAHRTLALVAQTGKAAIYTRPMLRQKLLYVATYDGRLIEIDPARGKQTELANGLGSIRATPALVEHTLYFGSGNRKLYAFDLKAKHLRVVCDGLPGGLRSPVSVMDGHAYAADTRGQVHAVRLADGSLRRSYELGDEQALAPGGFAIANGRLWLGALDGRLHAIQPNFGDEGWAREQAEQAGDWLAVAAFIVRGKEGASGWRERKAAELLADKGKHAEAAAIYQALNEKTKAATEYELAAQELRLPLYWREAGNLWQALGHDDHARECQRLAAQLGNSPLLDVEFVGIDPLKVGGVGSLRINIRNKMPNKASLIKVNLVSHDFEPCESLFLGELTNTGAVSCRLRLVAKKHGMLPVNLEVIYLDDARNEFSQRWAWDIPVEEIPTIQQTIIQKQFNAPSVINEGDVGMQKFSADGFSAAQMTTLMDELGKLRDAVGTLVNLDERTAALEAIAAAESHVRAGHPRLAGRVVRGGGNLVFDLAKGIGANLLTGLITQNH